MSSAELRQRLAAILAADVTGYSRLMAADERATVAALVRLGREAEGQSAARQALAFDPGFTIRGFSVTAGLAPTVYSPIADASRTAGLPE